MKNRYMLFYTIGVTIFIGYSIVLYQNYDNLPAKIISRIDLNGSVKGVSDTKQLYIASIVNFFLLIIILLSFKFPQIINYPDKPTEKEALKIFNEKAKTWMSYLSIVVSVVFSSMIFYNLHLSWLEIGLFYGVFLMIAMFLFVFWKKD